GWSGAEGQRDDGGFYARWRSIRRAQWRTAIQVHRSDLVQRELRDTRGDRLFLGETFCRWRIDGALRLAQRQIRSLVAGHSALSRLHVSRSRCREGESRHESDNGNGQDRHRRFEQSCDIAHRVRQSYEILSLAKMIF